MDGANTSIINMYETLGHTPEEIAAIESFDVAAVKSILLAYSAKYRQAVKVKDEDGFTDDEAIRAKRVMVELMDYAEDEHLRGRMAMFIRNDKKGRLDEDKNALRVNVNISLLNQHIQQAAQRIAESKNKVIELADHEIKLLRQAESRVA